MTKKTITVYSLLFLCAFTFGLSFTLASEVKAEPGCCIIDWCAGPPPYVGAYGHWAWNPVQRIVECVVTGTDSCDVVYECSEDQ